MTEREKRAMRRKRKNRIVTSLWLCITVLSSCLSFALGAVLAKEPAFPEKETETVQPAVPVLPSEASPEPSGSQALILVNKDHKLPDNYSITLRTLPDGVNKAAAAAYDPLCRMLADGSQEGLSFEICSSYRSVERQTELFDEDVLDLMSQGYTYESACEEVAKETMPPGYSEHSTGLAFDIVALDYQMLDSQQKNTPESIWLKNHCAEYGFILRYPEDKEHITGISFESWHFRYVGEEAAQIIMSSGITLEEYLEP